MEDKQYPMTAALLDREIARREQELAQLRDERRSIVSGTAQAKTVSTFFGPQPAPAISCAEAIDRVLSLASAPLTVREIHESIATLANPTLGDPNIPSIRSVLHRRHEAMGWKKHGHGTDVKWSKRTGGAP